MEKIIFKKTDMITGLIVTGLFIFLSFSSFWIFEALEGIIYGIEMRLDLPRRFDTNKIAIVNIDDKSLKQLGPWPWPRHIIADMIAILKDNGAKMIGLDLVFSEKEQNQGLQEVRDLYNAITSRDETAENDTWVLNRLKQIENRLDNDRILSDTVKESGNLIFPILGSFGKYETELVLTQDSFLEKNSIKSPNINLALKDIISVNQVTTPFLELAKNSHGLGHLVFSPNKSMKGRVHLLFINYRGHIIPSMPLRLSIDYLDKKPEEVLIQGREIRLVKSISPTPNGEIFIKFKGGRRSFPYYSFVDILKVKKVPSVFDNKIVLIGYTAEGATSINTPVDPKMPRVELTANIIEGLMNGRYLKRPGTMIYIELLLILFLGLSTSFILPRLKLINRLGATIGFLFLIILMGVISFMVLDIWFKTIYMALTLMTIFIVTFIEDFSVKQRSLVSKESIETNRMLGLSFQSQGLLDLAFEKLRKCPLDDSMKDVIYNLGLDYERKRMTNKAISVYEYITQKDSKFRDLEGRIPKLKKLISGLTPGYRGKKEEKIVVADDLEIKPTVGRYEILKELGQGAMGVVYLARDPKIQRHLAIKTIRFSDEFEEDKIEEVKDRFLKEAEIAGQLSHPSIVSVYDVGEDYDLTYLAMELLEGEDLQKYCRKGSLLPLKKVLYIISETATALDYAHRHGVIHRDIKPANIMLIKNGKAKVTDFGIAKAVTSSQTKSGIILGTPNYMSPEQINGQEIDGRSDIFSLGVVLFELLTGQLPFHGKTLTNLLYNITQTRHPSLQKINPKIPKPIEQIVDKALSKSPDHRFRHAGDIAKYLKAMIARMDQLSARKNRLPPQN